VRTSCWSFEGGTGGNRDPAVRSGRSRLAFPRAHRWADAAAKSKGSCRIPFFRPFFLTAARNKTNRSSRRLSAMVARKR
jgi:hypothetical protein